MSTENSLPVDTVLSAPDTRRQAEPPSATPTDTLESSPVPAGPVVRAQTNDRAASQDRLIQEIDATLDLLADATAAAAEVRACGIYDITIIVPVFNERNTLPEVLDRIDEVMPPSTETIIVDDGSSDGTELWLKNLNQRPDRKVILRRRNHGKGSAVRCAIRHSRGRVVAIQDADLEYDPGDLLAAIWPILDGKADAVYGSRYRGRVRDPSLVHRLGNWTLTQFSNLMTGMRLTDMETCQKAFRGDLLRSIALQEPRFGFEPEITAKIAAREAVVMEVPVGYQPRSYAEGKKIHLADAFEAVSCMWKYRRG